MNDEQFLDLDDDPIDDDDARCICDGAGYKVICIDDMCRGAGECFHGDGEIPCPVHASYV